MHNLGETRSVRRADHLLLTPDTFVRAPLPGMKKCMAIVHVAPAIGAAFTQYTAEFEASGELGDTPAQRFVYVLEGAVKVDAEGKKGELGPGGYAFLPEGADHSDNSIETTIRTTAIAIDCHRNIVCANGMTPVICSSGFGRLAAFA